MDIEKYREFCLSFPCAEETTPFDEVTLVYKVGGKMFALIPSDNFGGGVLLKCDPDRAVELRDDYPEDILPGWHMNKKHWNTVRTLGNLPEELIRSLTRHSYELVVAALPKKIRESMESDLYLTGK